MMVMSTKSLFDYWSDIRKCKSTYKTIATMSPTRIQQAKREPTTGSATFVMLLSDGEQIAPATEKHITNYIT